MQKKNLGMCAAGDDHLAMDKRYSNRSITEPKEKKDSGFGGK